LFSVLFILQGMQIALGADLRFSTKDCRLSIMEAKWGLIPDMSGSITLRELGLFENYMNNLDHF
jgi:enoyl-CoA hydratase/carnithine racemase